MADTLTQLAQRVEALTGPDREIDGLIAVASGLYVLERRRRDRKEWFYPTVGTGMRKALYGVGAERLPSYTRSVDAALTLVPEGLHFEVTTTGYKPGATVCGNSLTGVHEGSYAATPALALTAAALRAHAAKGGR